MPSLFLPILTLCTALSNAPAHHLDPKAGTPWPGHADAACWQVVIPNATGPLDLAGCLALTHHVNSIPDSPGITSRMTCALVVAGGGVEDSSPPAATTPNPPSTPPIPPSQGSGGGASSQDQQL